VKHKARINWALRISPAGALVPQRNLANAGVPKMEASAPADRRPTIRIIRLLGMPLKSI
jgi:hypothetical protein